MKAWGGAKRPAFRHFRTGAGPAELAAAIGTLVKVRDEFYLRDKEIPGQR